MNNVLKFLLLAAGCIIVVVLISLGFNLANKGKADVDTNVEKYNTLSSKYQDIEITMYDGMMVLGSEVKQLIRDYSNDEYLSILVETNMGNKSVAYVNSSSLVGATSGDPKDHHDIATMKKEDKDYINDRGEFIGKVYYDDNDLVACLEFKQQK